ncbi:MAG: ABC transporter permease [Abditibacteriota bacterium]|nr:ABC transporter permease [Abditibacteriota bacterium]
MKKLMGMMILLVVLMAFICIVQFFTTGEAAFLKPINLANLLQRVGMLGIYSLGASIVIISGGIDLSIGSVIALVATATALFAAQGISPWVIVICMLPVCALLGWWHSFIVGRFDLQPFMATLASLLFFRGFARGIADGKGITLDATPAFNFIGNGNVCGIPMPFIILLVLGGIVAFIMNYTVMGRYLFAVGRNTEAVRYSGIKVNTVRTVAYVICALLAGIAGAVELSYTGEVQPANTGLMYEMWAGAAAVLGGCSLRGGEGTVFGVIIGAALIRVMENGMNLVGIPSDWQWSVIGAVVICGVIADAAHKQRQAKQIKS